MNNFDALRQQHFSGSPVGAPGDAGPMGAGGVLKRPNQESKSEWLRQLNETPLGEPSRLLADSTQVAGSEPDSGESNDDALREKFQEFVGQTFFGELIKSLRSAQKGAAYFNGGRAEEIFQGQFDQTLSEHLSAASASTISDPMFKLFQLGRSSG